MMTPRSSSSGSFFDMCVGREAAHVEAGDQVQVDRATEQGEVVRTLLGEGALAGAAAGGVHDDVQAAERLDRLVQRRSRSPRSR